jgi:hypothetical protein
MYIIQHVRLDQSDDLYAAFTTNGMIERPVI